MIGASATAPLRGARAAFLFLTRIPVGGGPYRDVDWQWATAWFPFVGACVGLMMAGSFIMAAPIIVLFFFVQRYFIQGISLTGTKG